MCKLTITNEGETRLAIETNTSMEITGPNPPPPPGVPDRLQTGDVMTINSGREVKIILRDGSFAVLVL